MMTPGQDLAGSGTGRRLPVRPRAASGSWLFPAAVAASVLVVGAVAVFLAATSGTSRGQHVGNVAHLLASLVAGLACAKAARRGGPEGRG